jgi:hypothetical protein
LKRDRRFTVLSAKQTPLTRFFDGCGDEELAKLKVLADQRCIGTTKMLD